MSGPAEEDPDRASGMAQPFSLRTRDEKVQKHEKFLLGAFAELIDNSSEAMSRTLKIDVDYAQTGALYFLDDGIGMDRDTIHTLFTTNNESTKGLANYGVGFKTGAFNLGEEILVLTKNYECGPSCQYRKKTLRGIDSECTCAAEDKKPVQSCVPPSPPPSADLAHLLLGWPLNRVCALQVRSLGFMSTAWSLSETGPAAPCKECDRPDSRRIKVATVFWDVEGKAITKDRRRRETLPGSDKKMQDISFEHVEDEMKSVTEFSRLHTVEAVQSYFDKIPGTGTLILLYPLQEPSSKKQVSDASTALD